ncbi:hypothetical protein K458DRAFT_423106 [Lentithecium fluviatile CBS 122367]|uniref:Uncharacterized protein n=1 Tax=Lentithecium fluviatile CBS 122367 TaxID=1168545 RepID=A0A6G1IJK8_9PLEO|nr:hypothetical protein K458DRAFT_423106 [Lentithecium fluviatile CBS 122367]
MINIQTITQAKIKRTQTQISTHANKTYPIPQPQFSSYIPTQPNAQRSHTKTAGPHQQHTIPIQRAMHPGVLPTDP